MLDTRPQGAAYRRLNGQPFVQSVTLAELMLDGQPLWDDKVLKFTLDYHFEKIISKAALREQHNMEFSPHMILPWLEQYIEHALKLNSMNRITTVSMKDCVERAQKSMMTPNQAEFKLSRPTLQRKSTMPSLNSR